MVIRTRFTAVLAVALLSAALAAPAGAARTPAELSARVSQSDLHEGDTFDLLVSATGDGPSETPDLTVLRRDFEILGVRQSQRLSVVNGVTEASRDWIVTLSPLRTGDLVVPSLRAGDAASEPIRVRVSAATAAPDDATATATAPSNGSASGAAATGASGASGAPRSAIQGTPDLYLEASVDDAAPYVQGQVRYTVRVFDGVGIREGTLAEPRAAGARITPLGEPRESEREVNGRRYRIHERDFTVAPETAGELTIPPVTLQARVPAPRGQGRGRSAFDEFFGDDAFDGFPFGAGMIDRMMNPGREVRLRSNPVTLNVNARPGEVQGEWFLPAKRIELAEAWDPAQPTFRVGESVQRTLTLRALGASAEQLPAIEAPAVDGLRQYPEGTRDATTPSPDGLISIREQVVSLVPSRAGRLALPAIEIAWWDVDAKQARTATLPAREIEVLPAAGSAPAPATAARPATSAATGTRGAAAATDASAAAPSTNGTVDGGPPHAANSPYAAVLVLGTVVAALLVTAGATLVLRRRRAATVPPPDSTLAPASRPQERPRRLADEVRRACAADDPAAARDALLRWARAVFPDAPPTGVSAVARRLGDDRFARAVAELESHLYGRATGAWSGSEFARSFDPARGVVERDDATPASPLPPLYPTSRAA